MAQQDKGSNKFTKGIFLKSIIIFLLILLPTSYYLRPAQAIEGDVQFKDPSSGQLGGVTCGSDTFLQLDPTGKLKCAEFNTAFQNKAPTFGNLSVSGNVGVGTTNPQKLLDAVGDGRFQSDLFLGGIKINRSTDGVSLRQFSAGNNNSGTRYYFNNGTSLGYLYGDGAGFGFLNAAGNAWVLRLINSGTSVEMANHSFQTTRLYDYSDTNYSIAPAGSSTINVLNTDSLCFGTDCRTNWPADSTFPDTGLVAYWKMDDPSGTRATDYLNTNHGTASGSTPSTDAKLGLGSRNFDGTSDYVDAGTPAAFNLGATFTVSAWVKPTAFKNYSGLVSKVISSRAGVYSFMLVLHNDGKLGAYNNTSWQFSSGAALSLGTWQHVVFVLSGGTLTYYVNGSVNGSHAFAYPDTDAHNVFIGSWHTDPQYDYNGKMDDVGIWNRALTIGEIADLYKSGAGQQPLNPGFPTGSTSLWAMDEASGSTVADSVGSNNATATGTSITTGRVGKARTFSASTSEKIDAADSASLEPAALTVQAWIKPATVNTTKWIVEKGSSNTANGLNGYGLHLLDNIIRFYLITGANVENIALSTSTLSANNWYHVVATYDGSNMRIYINGALDKTQAVTGAIDYTGSDQLFRVGLSHANSLPFSGQIDEIGVWPRALTAIEILDLYNGGDGNQPTWYGAQPTPTPLPDCSNQTFTASGTWVKPAGVSQVTVSLIGGGGGGGGGEGTADGGGGGGGGAGRAYYDQVLNVSGDVTVTVGAGGAGGALEANGGAGGTTSFGGLLSAAGGAGGLASINSANYGGTGGASGTGAAGGAAGNPNQVPGPGGNGALDANGITGSGGGGGAAGQANPGGNGGGGGGGDADPGHGGDIGTCSGCGGGGGGGGRGGNGILAGINASNGGGLGVAAKGGSGYGAGGGGGTGESGGGGVDAGAGGAGAVGKVYVSWCGVGAVSPAIFANITSGSNFSVPAGVSSITVKAWGAGGGLTGAAINTPGKGSGGGGFATATVAVTPGEVLTVRVGQGGSIDATTSTNGGGASGYPNTGGGGGGYSGIFRGSTPLIIAGAGGGAAAGGGLGGVGGGTTGGNGDPDGAAVGCSGTGGTQSAGGTGGATGSSLTGANGQAGVNGGGGGGGGYWGGGGGCLYGNGGGGGGGGSSYVGCAGCTSTTTTSGSNIQAANQGDANYAAGVGMGRTGGYGQAVNLRGGDGRVVILW
jgi:hypothetical protein